MPDYSTTTANSPRGAAWPHNPLLDPTVGTNVPNLRTSVQDGRPPYDGLAEGKVTPDCRHATMVSCCRVRCSDEETVCMTGMATWPKHHCCAERCKNFAPRDAVGAIASAT